MRLEDRPFWRPMGQQKLPCDGERLHLSRDGTSDQILVRKGAKRIKFSWCPVTSWRLILERSRSVQSGHWLDGNQGDVGSCFPEMGEGTAADLDVSPLPRKKCGCSVHWSEEAISVLQCVCFELFGEQLIFEERSCGWKEIEEKELFEEMFCSERVHANVWY